LVFFDSHLPGIAAALEKIPCLYDVDSDTSGIAQGLFEK
jgi:hypothetical protein